MLSQDVFESYERQISNRNIYLKDCFFSHLNPSSLKLSESEFPHGHLSQKYHHEYLETDLDIAMNEYHQNTQYGNLQMFFIIYP